MNAKRQDIFCKYIRNNKTITGRLHDEMVMMDVDQGKYFSLNQVGTHIWDLLEKPLDVDGICKKLMEEYEVDSDRCVIEVLNHLDEMMKLGLVLKVEK